MKTKIENLSEKIRRGLRLSYIKLIKEKAKEDSDLIFSDNGKIVRVKAKQLLSELNIH
ncbi:MAG: hypothetical protein KF900_03275 [Bacteroidetes bacterium]|nr:hypothetical protein [Bacteroidota bacterium]